MQDATRRCLQWRDNIIAVLFKFQEQEIICRDYRAEHPSIHILELCAEHLHARANAHISARVLTNTLVHIYTLQIRSST